MIRFMNSFKTKLNTSPPLISSLFINYHDPCPVLLLVPNLTVSSSFSTLTKSCHCKSVIPFNQSVKQSTLSSSNFKGLLFYGNSFTSSSCLYCSQHGSDEKDDIVVDNGDRAEEEHEGTSYAKFADQYRQKAEELKQTLSRVNRLDKLFDILYDNIDYVGSINSGVFISRLSHLTDPREKNRKKLTQNQIEFLTKLVLVNINVLPDVNLLSLVAIIMSQNLPDEHNLTATTLQQIRRRIEDLSVNHLIWLWKQSGFRLKSSENSKEWLNLREEIINVVEKRVNDFKYDFQNVTEISQLARILLAKPNSVPYLHRLLKNITIFTESIDYSLAWPLISQLSSSSRRFERIDSQSLDAIFKKCYEVIQDKFYENNFQMDNYVKDYFLKRVIESPESFKIPYNQAFFKSLRKLVKINQKHLGPKELIKCLHFFGVNQYYPADLINSYCIWIKDHQNDYLSDFEHNPTLLVKLISECRCFETKKDEWKSLSQIILDPVKISCLNQMEKFFLLSYLMVMEDYSQLKNFCPEFDELCQNTQLQKPFWRAFQRIYAGLSKDPSIIGIEGQLIKTSLEKYSKRARKVHTFTDKFEKEEEFDELLTNALGNRSFFTKKVWTSSCVLLNYVILMDKQGNPKRFIARGKNNPATLDSLIQGLENYHVFVLFPVDESHYCYEPPIMRGQFNFRLSMIKQNGYIPITIDRRNWRDLTEKQKIASINREIESVKAICFGAASIQ